jgi:hypothetical protein
MIEKGFRFADGPALNIAAANAIGVDLSMAAVAHA